MFLRTLIERGGRGGSWQPTQKRSTIPRGPQRLCPSRYLPVRELIPSLSSRSPSETLTIRPGILGVDQQKRGGERSRGGGWGVRTIVHAAQARSASTRQRLTSSRIARISKHRHSQKKGGKNVLVRETTYLGCVRERQSYSGGEGTHEGIGASPLALLPPTVRRPRAGLGVSEEVVQPILRGKPVAAQEHILE